jgi:hypothetical protein
MLEYRLTPSVRRVTSLPYYAVGAARQWVRFAAAVIDETAAALCRRQWQLAPVRVVASDSRAIAARANAARFARRID